MLKPEVIEGSASGTGLVDSDTINAVYCSFFEVSLCDATAKQRLTKTMVGLTESQKTQALVSGTTVCFGRKSGLLSLSTTFVGQLRESF